MLWGFIVFGFALGALILVAGWRDTDNGEDDNATIRTLNALRRIQSR